MQEKIVILDFGSQTTQLIARRVRELNTYCEILPYNKFPKGDESAFKTDLSEIRGKYPVLGICYGAQFIAYTNGGKVEPAGSREYGRAHLSSFDKDNVLFKDVKENTQVWMSHGDTITVIPSNFKKIASTDKVAIAAYQIENEKVWGVQFHPEVFHSEDGTQMLKNFVVDVCGCKQDWSAASFIETTVAELKEQLGDDKVVLGLSGGVDSSVAAVLLNRAIGKNLTCIFVDHGMLRKNEFKNVLHDYECLGLNVIGVDASAKFFAELAGVTEPEEKRKIIGKGFIEVFDEEAHKIKDVKWLAQGTIYPDCIESLSITGTVIKSHHNVGGLPEKMHLKLCEPLRLLFKDEVRRVGRGLGMPEHLITRHPFPGPGLAVRILGDITPEKVAILQNADDIFIQGLPHDSDKPECLVVIIDFVFSYPLEQHTEIESFPGNTDITAESKCGGVAVADLDPVVGIQIPVMIRICIQEVAQFRSLISGEIVRIFIDQRLYIVQIGLIADNTVHRHDI